MNDAALVLDCRGLKCPLPVLRLAVNLGDVAVGEVIAVLADDLAARTDIPAWCRMRGQEFVAADSADDGTPVYLVRRTS